MQSTLRVAVCEDTKADEDNLLALLEACPIPTCCTVFKSSSDFFKAYRPQTFDLLLADIYLGDKQPAGIEIVSRLREQGDTIPVAFITSCLDFTLESYRLSALKYIEKPFKQSDLEDILNLALLKKNSAPSFCFQKNRREERIPFSQILYFEQQKHQLFIHLQDGSILQIYDKLSAFLDQLETQHFFSPHKSFAVNLAFVCGIDHELRCFVMQNGENIPIRRESLSPAKKALETFLFTRTRGLS